MTNTIPNVLIVIVSVLFFYFDQPVSEFFREFYTAQYDSLMIGLI